MNKQQAQQFRIDFQNAVKQLEQQYGAKITIGTIRYEEDGFSTKLSLSHSQYSTSPSKPKVTFKVGDIVNINHKSISPSMLFVIQKVNKVNIEVKATAVGSSDVFMVSPTLLSKVV